MYSLEYMKIITRDEVQNAELKSCVPNTDEKINVELNVVKGLCNFLMQKIMRFKKITYGH